MKLQRFLGLTAVLLTIGATLSTAAHAQDTKTDGVYQIMKATETRVWRLNTQTGEIAVCDLSGNNLVCTNTTDAAAVPKKSYEEIEAERKAEMEAADRKAAEDRARELKFLDKILAFVRELIQTALGQSPSS